ncbi:MAG: histidine phosphatase family protein [Clostridia bacterium]|nr:histidine phosphatase family protein [Clostridia bacterium]
MKLYMVRHGQSETNLSGCFTGWAQVSLTEKGLEDAKLAGEYLKGKTFDRIYASDLKRAIQTAQAAIPGCDLILTPQLREISVGRLELCSVAECEKKYGPRFMVTPQGYDLSPYGGENHQMLRERVGAFMAELEHESDEQVIAFSHAGVILCMLDIVLGQNVDRTKVRIGNGKVVVFAWEKGRWLLETWGAGV